MGLKEKLNQLGFKEIYKHGQFFNRDLDLYVYIRYNKIEFIQISKVWDLKNFNNYNEYISKVYFILNQIESLLYSKGE